MTNETQPNKVTEPQSENPTNTQPQKVARSSRLGFLISLLVLIAALGLGSMGGYGRGVSERVSAQGTKVAQQLGDQFILVQEDIDAGRYSVARQRLEYIIQQQPTFPGAADKLAEVLVKQAITPSPVPTATATITPTPDMRGQESIYSQAQQQYDAKEWTVLMSSLDSLRKADPTYKAAVIDGMYYSALRNRGIDQILGIGVYKTSNMEGGIYDLTLAERFGPLDGYADGLRNFTRMYIVASSFWDVNWPQAVNYFRQVSQYAPNLRDSSNVTASQRLYQALLKYGDQLSQTGKLKDRCVALDMWSEAASLTALDNDYSYKFNQLNLECNPPTEVPTEVPAVVAPPADVVPTDVTVEPAAATATSAPPP
ncbi:MAG: hypothetical protein NTW32_01430 [Chloroflexi bacterium]|nr:hypothetical protein [Chloroflexota bacterium]